MMPTSLIQPAWLRHGKRRSMGWCKLNPCRGQPNYRRDGEFVTAAEIQQAFEALCLMTGFPHLNVTF